MTEEEKEAMRHEQYLRQLKVWKQEEAHMVRNSLYHHINIPNRPCKLLEFPFTVPLLLSQFAQAYAALSDARQERKSTAEIIKMVCEAQHRMCRTYLQ